MGTFTIEIKASELAGAINNLASALASTKVLDLYSLANISDAVNRRREEPHTANGSETETKVLTHEAVSEEETPIAEEPLPSYTIEDVRAAFSAFAKANGKDKAKELLSKYGANKVTTLNSESYAAVMKDIEEG